LQGGFFSVIALCSAVLPFWGFCFALSCSFSIFRYNNVMDLERIWDRIGDFFNALTRGIEQPH
jgi:hypothetical protein